MYNAQYTADCIKKLLIDRHMTAKDMCQKCDLGINTLSNIRRGDVKSIETFCTIADFLDCSIDFLVGRQNLPEKQEKFNISTTTIEDDISSEILNTLKKDTNIR